MPYTVITATTDFQLVKNNGYVLNLAATTSTVNLKMPLTSGLVPGDRLELYPYQGKAKIQNNASDAGFLYKGLTVSEIPLDNENILIGFVWSGSVLGWLPQFKYDLTYTLYSAPASTTAYTASQNGVFSGAQAATYANMTDNNVNTGTLTTSGSPAFIQATFPFAVTVSSVIVSGGQDPSVGLLASELENSNIQYSLNGTTGWTTVATVTGINNNTSFFTFNFTAVEARYWRIAKNGFTSTGTFKFLP